MLLSLVHLCVCPKIHSNNNFLFLPSTFWAPKHTRNPLHNTLYCTMSIKRSPSSHETEYDTETVSPMKEQVSTTTGLDGDTDEILVQQLQTGQKAAFTILVTRWQHRVYSQCYRMLGDVESAKDASQEIFVKLYKGIGSFQHQSSFATWLFRIISNHCSNKRAYNARHHLEQHDSVDNPESWHTELADEQATEAITHLQHKDMQHIIQHALSMLSPDQREVLILRDIQDFSYEEIANILQSNLGTIKSRVHRARNALKPILTELLEK